VSPKKQRGPLSKYSPPHKEVRIKSDPLSHDREKPVWSFSVLDEDHAQWGWRNVNSGVWWDDILPKLQNFETMTWAEILRPAGGRSHGNNNHPIPVAELCKAARDRLVDLQQDDIDTVFSLRLAGAPRVMGIREGRVLKILWFDPDHEVCPVQKR
jgi:hypothetical protein